jgi:8-hydroxy-5-deazaflavin:NADPH oxidoreductase
MEKKTLAILGGTGQLGGALALRWARAGHAIIIGSRDRARAGAKALDIRARAPDASVSGADLAAAASAAEIVVLAVPYPAQRATLEAVKDALGAKILIDVTVPLMLPRVARVHLPAEGSAAVAAQAFLGPETRVVSAFQTVPAERLADPAAAIDCDVLVCGDDAAARDIVVNLARAAGLRSFHGGPLANSAAAEAMASVLIYLNGRYRARASGIRFTGISDEENPA